VTKTTSTKSDALWKRCDEPAIYTYTTEPPSQPHCSSIRCGQVFADEVLFGRSVVSLCFHRHAWRVDGDLVLLSLCLLGSLFDGLVGGGQNGLSSGWLRDAELPVWRREPQFWRRQDGAGTSRRQRQRQGVFGAGKRVKNLKTRKQHNRQLDVDEAPRLEATHLS